MSDFERRLTALREELARRGLNGFVVPSADEHMSESVGAYAQRLAWLTGFTGSAGTAVVLQGDAALFVDGRYTLQARRQAHERLWRVFHLPKQSVEVWLNEHTPEGARIAYDPWLHTKSWVGAARAALTSRGAELVPVESNPVDSIWLDKPEPSAAKVVPYPEALAGRSAADKQREIAKQLAGVQADIVVLALLDSIAWTFNVRGQDVKHTPVALAYALVYADATADLFIAPEKVTKDVIDHLGTAVRLHPRNSFAAHLATLSGKKVVLDPEQSASAIHSALDTAGATIIEARDPVVLAKACKNATEIACHKAAQIHDGIALSRFFNWLAHEVRTGTVTELSAAAQLRTFRDATGYLHDLAFDTISAFGPNGANAHYQPNEATCRALLSDGLYLLDSGGQYPGGTTDVTRTIAIGKPTAEMRDRFTRVLKGHIALACAIFPAGTRGVQLDVLARQHLWAVGCDYAHGTGHGVGAYLSVHEGPHLINGTPRAAEPLWPGMIVSNEPGHYKAGEYGIRLENLLLVVRCAVPGAEVEMLRFEVLTFAPFDRVLIDVELLTALERAWIDEYHAQVAQTLGPQLDPSTRAWLTHATRPLA